MVSILHPLIPNTPYPIQVPAQPLKAANQGPEHYCQCILPLPLLTISRLTYTLPLLQSLDVRYLRSHTLTTISGSCNSNKHSPALNSNMRRSISTITLRLCSNTNTFIVVHCLLIRLNPQPTTSRCLPIISSRQTNPTPKPSLKTPILLYSTWLPVTSQDLLAFKRVSGLPCRLTKRRRG